MNIVSTTVPYTYFSLQQNLIMLKDYFPFLKIEVVGESVLGKKIYAVRLGTGPNKVFYSASIHANEWITSIILMKFIEDYCDSFFTNSLLNGIPINYLFTSFSIYLIPMVNPDGVDLVNDVYNQFSYQYSKAKEISNNFPDIPFPSGWKANINRSRSKSPISCWLGKSKRNKICTRF